MRRDYNTFLRDYHQARWNEELIFDLSVPGQRGILVPEPDEEMAAAVGRGSDAIPAKLRRKKAPELPEVHQMRVNRHFLRLSQETLSADTTPDISEGTCTMKYCPRVQEHIAARNPDITAVHPLQPESTLQGILEIYYKTEALLKEISGLDAFSFQPGGGSAACYAGACVARAYHAKRGDTARDEIITTMFSHPCDAAAPATAGYKVITLMPNENGYPDLEAMKSVLSARTAAIFITNPEDTGLFNPNIRDFVDAAHAVGALAYYDQANVNGILGITRAREAGFDMLHYNLHKTFSAPHGGRGPGCGALGVREFLKPFLPVPRVTFDGAHYTLERNAPDAVGNIRQFFGNAGVVLRTYMWIMQMGAEGLREAAVCSVLNNQYLMKRLCEIPGISVWYAPGKRRIEQVRYSFEKLKEDTGLGTDDLSRRLADFGLETYHQSHHPFVVPEPFTLEPCESYSKDDLDEYVAVFRELSREAYEQPELIRTAPHNAAIHRMVREEIEEYEFVAATYQQWKRRHGAEK